MHWNGTSQSRGKLAALVVALLLAVLILAPSALAQAPPPDTAAPVVLEADDVGYDQKQGIVIARGNVEVMQGDYLLRADRLIYYQNQNLVRAEGKVSILQPSGDVGFADAVELKDDLKTGVIKNFSARLADNSVFVAREAKRLNPYQIRLKQAAYTPCDLCRGEDPFWQIKSGRVFIDEIDEKVTTKDSWMEMVGLPIFYTPYLSFPTPNSGAKSGFMVPEYSAGDNLGTVIKVPYYWRIAPDKQAVVTPWYLSQESPLLQVDYEQLTDRGNFTAQVSGTNPPKLDTQGNSTSGNEFRGHIYAKGSEDFAEHWRYGLDVNRASDDTYLRRYSFGDQSVLFSKIFVEGAQRRNYGFANGLAIQGLQPGDNPDTTPLILPTLEGYYETDPYASGLRLHAFANAVSLTRDIGVDQQRMSVTLGGNIPYVSDDGQVFKLTANLRNDLYNVNNQPINNNTELFNGTVTRTLPQGALEWRYPLIRQVENASLVVEPVVLAVAQDTGGNPQEISNQDNQIIQLSDTNIFSLNRMPGLDTYDSGSRLAYGLRSQYLLNDGKSIEMLLGQNYSVDADTPFPNSTTPGEHFSNYIGRAALDYQAFRLAYLFGLNNSTLAFDRNELTGDMVWRWFSASAAYLSVEQNQYLRASEEAYGSANIVVYKGWSVYGGMRQDLLANELIAANGGLVYRNECFDIMFGILRSNTRDRDIQPSTTYSLQVGFKNLGEFVANQ